MLPLPRPLNAVRSRHTLLTKSRVNLLATPPGLMMLNVPAYFQEQLMLSAADTPMAAFPNGPMPAAPPEPKHVRVNLFVNA